MASWWLFVAYCLLPAMWWGGRGQGSRLSWCLWLSAPLAPSQDCSRVPICLSLLIGSSSGLERPIIGIKNPYLMLHGCWSWMGVSGLFRQFYMPSTCTGLGLFPRGKDRTRTGLSEIWTWALGQKSRRCFIYAWLTFLALSAYSLLLWGWGKPGTELGADVAILSRVK